MDTVTVDALAPAEGFSARLRQATLAEHRATERSPFIRRLLSGRAPLGSYTAMTAQWFFLYEALEGAVTSAAMTDPVLRPFASDDLVRVQALSKDLAFLIGPDWRSRIEVTTATRTYTDRLARLSASWRAGLVAHHYLRYLGDLSGGQIIARVVGKTYGFDGDAGTAFYRFERIDDLAAFKAGYRARLDAAPVDEAERRRLIDEVDEGYRLTARVFDELERASDAA